MTDASNLLRYFICNQDSQVLHITGRSNESHFRDNNIIRDRKGKDHIRMERIVRE